jgi:hypothetical protein
MLSKVRTHAPLALASIALFFAIGGPSFAADGFASARKLITGKQVKNNSLTTKDVKNGSLVKADFRAGQLPSGAQGPQGPAGEQGPKGDPGAPNPNAADSDKLDGLDSSAFLRSTAQAQDAAKLGGADAASYATGGDDLGGGGFLPGATIRAYRLNTTSGSDTVKATRPRWEAWYSCPGGRHRQRHHPSQERHRRVHVGPVRRQRRRESGVLDAGARCDSRRTRGRDRGRDRVRRASGLRSRACRRCAPARRVSPSEQLALQRRRLRRGDRLGDRNGPCRSGATRSRSGHGNRC